MTSPFPLGRLAHLSSSPPHQPSAPASPVPLPYPHGSPRTAHPRSPSAPSPTTAIDPSTNPGSVGYGAYAGGHGHAYGTSPGSTSTHQRPQHDPTTSHPRAGGSAQMSSTPSPSGSQREGGPSGVGGGGNGAGVTAAVSGRNQKVDQIIQHFFSKTSSVVTHCRLTHYDSPSTLPFPSVRQRTDSGNSSLGSFQQQSHQVAPGTGKSGGGTGRKISKWFNLELEDTDVFRDELRSWRSVSSLLPSFITDSTTALPVASSPAPGSGLTGMEERVFNLETAVAPMIIDVLLDTSSLEKGRVLMLTRNDGRRVRVGSSVAIGDQGQSKGKGKESVAEGGTANGEEVATEPKNVVLESWKLELRPYAPPNPPELPTLYKRSIIHFRTLYTMAHFLPSCRLYRRLKRMRQHMTTSATSKAVGGMRIGCRMRMGGVGEEEPWAEQEIGLDDRIDLEAQHEGTEGTEGETESEVEIHEFSPILTPFGSLHTSVTYRTQVEFSVDDFESLMSLKFIEMDEDYFTPTMAKHAKRTSGSFGDKGAFGASLPSSGVRTSSAGRQRPLLSTSADRRSPMGSFPTRHASAPVDPVQTGLSSEAVPPSSPLWRTSSEETRVRRPSSFASSSQLATIAAGTPSTDSPPSPGRASPVLGGALPISAPRSARRPSIGGGAEPAFLTLGRPGSSGSLRARRTSFMEGAPGSVGGENAPPSPSSGIGSSRRPPLGTSYGSSSRTGAMPLSSSPSRPSSFSPSSYPSPSPLAREVGFEEAQSHSPQHPAARMAAYSHSPGQRSFTSGGSSLKSVFQPYSPHSPSALSNTSLPPASITTQQRGTASSSPSSGGGAPGTSVAPSQLIKRYSSNQTPRYGRVAQAGSGGGGATTAAASTPASGSQGSEGGSSGPEPSASGGSASGQGSVPAPTGAFARRSWGSSVRQTEASTSGAGGAFALSQKPRPSSASSFGGSKGDGQTASSAEKEIGEFVKMIDSRPDLAHSLLLGAQVEPGSEDVPSARGALTTRARGDWRIASAGTAEGTDGGSDRGAYRRSFDRPASGSLGGVQMTALKGGSIILSRSHVDEMLARMASSLALTRSGSGTGAEPTGSGLSKDTAGALITSLGQQQFEAQATARGSETAYRVGSSVLRSRQAGPPFAKSVPVAAPVTRVQYESAAHGREVRRSESAGEGAEVSDAELSRELESGAATGERSRSASPCTSSVEATQRYERRDRERHYRRFATTGSASASGSGSGSAGMATGPGGGTTPPQQGGGDARGRHRRSLDLFDDEPVGRLELAETEEEGEHLAGGYAGAGAEASPRALSPIPYSAPFSVVGTSPTGSLRDAPPQITARERDRERRREEDAQLAREFGSGFAGRGGRGTVGGGGAGAGVGSRVGSPSLSPYRRMQPGVGQGRERARSRSGQGGQILGQGQGQWHSQGQGQGQGERELGRERDSSP